ncbi:shikimate kinase [Actinomyces sp.]|uniref:shikimate kinase n=1 Tax=Actinomyces sp. TaxID=29317 RepID=UPI0026DCBB39|nr:shikimate kinase [Actinomyces sp.]MDO4900891.1 shikimate kinase [Actinomyces sp.]
MSPAGVVLLGVPGAGCSSVGRVLADTRGAALFDVGQETARALGTTPELALVAVPEERYRQTLASTALKAILRAEQEGAVVALGSGCLSDQAVQDALVRATAAGVRLVHLTASVRRLATRNGMDAPRSVALGNVRQTFTRMLRERESACARTGAAAVDTTDTTPAQAAAVIAALDSGRSSP